MNERLRVTHIIPSMDVSMGGPPVAVAGWARGLERIGDVTAIVTTSQAGPARWRANRPGLTGPRLPAGVAGMDIRVAPASAPHRLGYARELGQILEETVGNSDIVHIHMLYLYATFAGCRTARRMRVPFVVSPHGALDPYILRHGRPQKWLTDVLWQRRALEAADAIFVTTEQEGRLIGPLRLRAPVSVVPIGLEPESFFAAARLRRELGPAVIINHGRLASKKSLDILVDALPIVHRFGQRARLKFIGPDPDGIGRDLLARAARLGVASSLELVGPMYGDALAQEVAAASIWVLPSASENFGIAIVEAMAAGLPVIVTPDVNLAESAQAAGACYIVPREPNALAQSILSLLADEDARAAMSIAARAFASRFGLAEVAKELHAAYVTAIEHAAVRR